MHRDPPIGVTADGRITVDRVGPLTPAEALEIASRLYFIARIALALTVLGSGG